MADGLPNGGQPRPHGSYDSDPDPAQLARWFHLDENDRALIEVRRGDHNRLGFAVQVCTVRFLGTFLPAPADVPWAVAVHLAAQLGVPDPSVLKTYAGRDATHREHAGLIQAAYGYTDFSDPGAQADLQGWLAARTALGAERPGTLFDLATARLLERNVLLPGPTVLARQIATARELAETTLWQTLTAATAPTQKQALLALLTVSAGDRVSGLERLRRGPTGVTANGMLGALNRLAELRALGVGAIDLSTVPPGRLAALARHGIAAKAQTVARMTTGRRDATLLAAARHLQAVATDDALDLLDQLLGSLLARAQRAGRQERIRTLPELDVAATHLRDAVKVLLDPPEGDLAAVWAAITARVTREQLQAAVAAVDQTTRPDVDTHLQDLLTRYTTVRRFLPAPLTTLTGANPSSRTGNGSAPALLAAPGGVDVLAAFTALAALEGRRTVKADEVPLDLATGPWLKRCTNPDGTLNRLTRSWSWNASARPSDAVTSMPRGAPGGPTPVRSCSPVPPGRPPGRRSPAVSASPWTPASS